MTSTVSELKTRVSNKRQLEQAAPDEGGRHRKQAKIQAGVGVRRFILPLSHRPIPTAVLARIEGSYLIAPGRWGPLRDDPLALTHASAETEVTVDQLASYRNQLLRQKWAGAYARFAMKRKGHLGAGVLQEMHAAGYSARDLAVEYDLPPMFVARELGWVQNQDQKQLTEEEQKDLEWCQANDVVFPVTQAADQMLENATKFEESLTTLLKSLGLPFWTQQDLAAEHKAQVEFLVHMRQTYGVPEELKATKEEDEEGGVGPLPQLGPTPDILLRAPVQINGHLVHWIDAKNCFGSVVPHMLKKMQKQTAKYTAKWGPGALVFSLGFDAELARRLPDVLLLSF